MYCEKCGAEITGADKFCPKCGAAVSAVQPIGTVKTPVSPNEKKNDAEVKEYSLNDKEIEKLSASFVSRDEKFIVSLGNGYIMNYLANKTMSRGFAFITNKRVYFKGSCLSGTGKKLVKTDEERSVDVKDITGSGFVYQRYMGILWGLLAAFITVSIGILLASQSQGNDYFSDMSMAIKYGKTREDWHWYWSDGIFFAKALLAFLVAFYIPSFLVFLKYLKKRKTLFRIEYAGGCIAFNVSYYAKAEIDDFQKQLRRAKDLAEESAGKAAVTESSIQAPVQSSASDDLRKYADLLKEGLISQEEYDAMKKKILNL